MVRNVNARQSILAILPSFPSLGRFTKHAGALAALLGTSMRLAKNPYHAHHKPHRTPPIIE
jgi:hypothetical protein